MGVAGIHIPNNKRNENPKDIGEEEDQKKSGSELPNEDYGAMPTVYI